MHILCLEQGGWMNPATYPSIGRDWEARAFGDYSPSPNIRARPDDYPINGINSPIKVVNFGRLRGARAASMWVLSGVRMQAFRDRSRKLR
jgi:hypothetical protein